MRKLTGVTISRLLVENIANLGWQCFPAHLMLKIQRNWLTLRYKYFDPKGVWRRHLHFFSIKNLSVFCVQNFIRYYIWGSLGVANVGGMMCMCMCGVFVMCVMYIVFVCMCMWCVCPGRKDNYSQSGFRAGWEKWCKVGNYPNFAQQAPQVFNNKKLHSTANTQPFVRGCSHPLCRWHWILT